ncbi:MAG: hypothetical protein JST64_08280 [Actinobacteria bacterium]|nr:hypothetical protein [Actinomycetota bacterium]
MVSSGPEAETGHPSPEKGAPPDGSATAVVTRPVRHSPEFDALFDRAFPAVVGLVRRALDRHRAAASSSDPVVEEIAIETLAKAKVHRFADTDRAAERIVGWAAELSLDRMIGHPGRVALPSGARAEDLLPQDLLDEGVGAEWDHHGLGLWELQEALAGARRVDRRVGVVCLACGMPPSQTAILVGADPVAVEASLRRIGTRLADRRRVSAEVESPLDARLGDQG